MNVPVELLVSFVVILVIVAAADIAIVARAFGRSRDEIFSRVAALLGAGILTAWATIHCLIAESGILQAGAALPPRPLIYLAASMLLVVALASSRVGRLVADHTPFAVLIGLNVFRVPLEIWLHQMYEVGAIPVQMTWSGLNFDVVTGLSAAVVAAIAWKGQAPRWLLWGWNILGSALLLGVVVIANLSAPTALRAFDDGPSLDFIFHAPYTLIATVLVATALFGHIVIFRKLIRES